MAGTSATGLRFPFVFCRVFAEENGRTQTHTLSMKQKCAFVNKKSFEVKRKPTQQNVGFVAVERKSLVVFVGILLIFG